MTDNLENSVIRLQKEIIDITKNINSVRIKTHNSMSSILKDLKSFPKDKPINPKYISLSIQNNKNHKKRTKKYKGEEKYLLINNTEYYKSNSNLNLYQPKRKVNNILEKRNKGIVLNEFENQYNNNKKREKSYKNDLILDNFNIKKRINKPIKYEESKSRNYKFDRNGLDKDIYKFNDNNKYQDSDRKKRISKTDSLKYIYKGINNLNNYNYTYDGKNNIYIENTYLKNNDNNYYKSELDNGDYINRLFNKNIDINIKPNIRSRNKNENYFKYKKSETQKKWRRIYSI